ncbi:MAG: PHP domain-containing protein [Verrucomicrobiota bacterium]
MKRILILSAGFGEGHNTAARNLRDALEYVSGDEAEAEIYDLFDSCYGRLNALMRRAYVTAINRTPRLWKGLYALADRPGLMEANMLALTRMRKALERLLHAYQPDVVVSTYPIYNYLIDELYEDGRQRHFSQVTVITDSISVNSLWYRCQSDWYIVPNPQTAEVLRVGGVPEAKIKPLGFPVQLDFADESRRGALPDLTLGGRPQILYLINSGKKQAPKVIEKLLEHDGWDLTISAGRDAKVLAMAQEFRAQAPDRVGVLGWTSHLPDYLMSHHVVVTKAGGATVQEAIAAQTPMVINQVVPGQESGNYELIRLTNCGALAEKPKEVVKWLERAFAHNARLWRLWKCNIAELSQPDSALEIAHFLLDEAVPHGAGLPELRMLSAPPSLAAPAVVEGRKQLLHCDFHTHTTFSDGKLSVPELVDLYGQRGFDVLAITDHLCDPKRLLGKFCNLTGLVLPPDEVGTYFETIRREAERALKKYGLIVMTGLEFNKDAITAKGSTHLLGLDLKEPIDPSLSLKDTIQAVHAQGGLTVASHPHLQSSVWGKNTLYLWENQEEYKPLIDAWEIANRDDIFNPVGLKRLPFLANSDLHKPKHIYSWKTLLYCEKEPEAIKECIRLNRDVSITLYRDHHFAGEEDGLIASSAGLGAVAAAPAKEARAEAVAG